jgi:hypothetical protein
MFGVKLDVGRSITEAMRDQKNKDALGLTEKSAEGMFGFSDSILARLRMILDDIEVYAGAELVAVLYDAVNCIEFLQETLSEGIDEQILSYARIRRHETTIENLWAEVQRMSRNESF